MGGVWRAGFGCERGCERGCEHGCEHGYEHDCHLEHLGVIFVMKCLD